MGIDHHGYVEPDHPEQELVREALQSVTGAAHEPERRGTDGCSIPTYAVPLKSMALGFARMATGNGLPDGRAKAARRILAACMAEPFFMSGTGRHDLAVISAGAGRIFVKTGAEGVYCGAVPELGLGIAIKCDDGTGRASETAVAAVLASLLSRDAELADKLNKLAHRQLFNWRGIHVGALRSAGPLAA
jgi:L-asparaginase II